MYTCNPNDPSFGPKRPCFKGLTFNDRFHLGSRSQHRPIRHYMHKKYKRADATAIARKCSLSTIVRERVIYTVIRVIIVVGTIHCACPQKCKHKSYQKSKKLKEAFFPSNVASPASSKTIRNKCVFRCDFNCSLATVISVQLRSIENWNLLLFGRIPSKMCACARN